MLWHGQMMMGQAGAGMKWHHNLKPRLCQVFLHSQHLLIGCKRYYKSPQSAAEGCFRAGRAIQLYPSVPSTSITFPGTEAEEGLTPLSIQPIVSTSSSPPSRDHYPSSLHLRALKVLIGLRARWLCLSCGCFCGW
jgi:hypothetical protein